MRDLETAYEELKEKYIAYMKDEASRAEHCPSKRVKVLRRNASGLAVRYVNHMRANVGDESCSKQILIDDETGEVEEDIIYKVGSLKAELTNANLTPIRCGLMTCLAIELLTKKKPHTIGYIGNGRINLANCEAITALIGRHEAVIRGSCRNRAKNWEKFELFAEIVEVDDTEDCSLLNQCDVVIVCTSTSAREDVIENDALRNVPLVIALDSGYLLGESFRKERKCFTDHKEQLEAHYGDEFPYDKEMHVHENLHGWMLKVREPLLVSLFGVAIADLVTVKHYIKEKMEEEKRVY